MAKACTYAAAVIMAFLINGCTASQSDRQTITASISPVGYLVKEIVGNDFNLDIMVPEGANPETFAPSAAQLSYMENSALIFTTGVLDFENELIARLPAKSQNRIVDLSSGIELIEGECGHGTAHGHGVDPHIWTSPELLRTMTDNIYAAINKAFPDSVKYAAAYERLIRKIDSVSLCVKNMVADSNRRYFIIYHPALTYYAADYGLEQIALEEDGKEPSASRMQAVIELARREEMNVILYQRQYPVSVVSVVASDANVEPVAINPLSGDILNEILRITGIIVSE